jgi:phenylacetate-coenzyme A ligase PaaK-like adenylate-forming protein
MPVVLRVLGRRRALRQRDRWTREQLQAYQARALRQLRDHAYAHSPFYQRFHAGRTDHPLHKLPVLTKAMVMEHFDQLVTRPAVKLAEVKAHLAALEGNERLHGRYWVAATSGTTGRRGIFLWDLDEWVTVLASYNRSLDWAGASAGLTRRSGGGYVGACASATWSAAWASRSPSGCSGPAVVSLAVCSSISALSSAPTRTTKAVRYSQNIKMMIPARAP